MPHILDSLNGELAEIFVRVRPSLVQIHNDKIGVGSGVIWNADGLIVTNAHVVMSGSPNVSDRLSVTFYNGRSVRTQVVAHNNELDIAVLAVHTDDLRPLVCGDSRKVAPGDWVTAMGFPWGVPGGVTSGIVVGAGAQLPEMGNTRREWIAASVHLRPGHSGGPMLDSRGQLVGINTIMTGPDVGGAIPIHVVEAFVNRLDLRIQDPTSRSSPTVHL